MKFEGGENSAPFSGERGDQNLTFRVAPYRSFNVSRWLSMLGFRNVAGFSPR